MLAGSKTRRTVPAVRGPQERAQALGQGRLDWSTWPRYEAAALGFREYWYPLAWARQVGRRPIRATLLGEELVLDRDAAGAVTASATATTTPEGSARTYPVAERIGLLWVYIGDADPPPVDTDIPAELLRDDAVIGGRRTIRHGNWRFGA